MECDLHRVPLVIVVINVSEGILKIAVKQISGDLVGFGKLLSIDI